jgi:hypothetical protein
MKKGTNNQSKHAQNNLRWSLIINVIAPFVLYELLRHWHVSDFAALAWSAAIPTVDTLRTWIVRRRVDWIGAFSVAEFGLQLLLSAVSGNSVLMLKAGSALTTGPVGLLFIISALLGKPLLIPLREAVLSSISGPQADRLSAHTPSLRHMCMISEIIGAVLLLHAVTIYILALTLPIATFMVVSKVLTWGGLVAAFVLVRFGRSRMTQHGGVASHV